ncbi:MAG: PKD domain containing protein, partial [Microthrixaceae bacterium]
MNTHALARGVGRARTRPRVWTAGLLAVLLIFGAAVAMDTSAVQPSTQAGRVVSDTNPAAWTPNVQDGYVAAFAEAGNTVLVGGNFSTVRRANTSANLTRNYLFAFDRTTGAISTTFVPTLNGEVRSIIYAGDGTAWIAGGFNNVNGQGARNLARIDITTGQRVTSFAPPVFNGRINDMQLRNGKLYLEGRFTTVGGQTHELIAAVDATTGALDPAVKVDFADPRSGGVLNVYAADVTPDGSRMVVTGNFTTINGVGRYQIAQLDLTTSPTSVANWQTNAYGNGCSGSFETYMRDVDYSPDGSFFVVVTTGAYNNTFLCDVAA